MSEIQIYPPIMINEMCGEPCGQFYSDGWEANCSFANTELSIDRDDNPIRCQACTDATNIYYNKIKLTKPMEKVSKYAVLIDELIEGLKKISVMSSGHKIAIEKLSEQTLKKYEKIKI